MAKFAIALTLITGLCWGAARAIPTYEEIQTAHVARIDAQISESL